MLKQIAEKSIRLRWRWSRAGKLDWWVNSVSSGSAGYAVQTAGSDGSKLLIFVLGAAQRLGPEVIDVHITYERAVR
jgi:hypothetical protein